MKKIERFVLSWDTLFALIAILTSYILLPPIISNKFCYTIYGMAITVLAIIFSIFFASLTVIMAFPDNEFITFIENPNKIFTKLLNYFRDTLFALFIVLLFTCVIYVPTALYDESESGNRFLFVIFCGVFTYSLIATIIAVVVTLKMTSGRAEYLSNKSKSIEDNEEETPTD